MASRYRREVERPIKLGRHASLEPDGTLRLPPIVQPKAEDPFADSKLLKYRFARQKDAQLTRIVCVFYCCSVFGQFYLSPITYFQARRRRTSRQQPVGVCILFLLARRSPSA